jgi:hypothetical protein
MTVLDNFRATLRTLLPADVTPPDDDQGLTGYVVDGSLDLDEFGYELGESIENIPGEFPDEDPFLSPGHPHLSEPQMRALAWLAPVFSAAERLRACAGFSCDDPTLRSLARSYEEGRLVKSGLVWRVEPPPPRTLSDAVHAMRNMVLGSYIAAGGFGLLGYLGCKPVCHVCPASPIMAATDVFPIAGGFAAVIALIVLLPGFILLVRDVAPAAVQTG